MNRYKILRTIKIKVDPYMFFWYEWVKNENSTLTESEVDFLNCLINTDFEYHKFDFPISNREIELINRKLELGYEVFKQFIVNDFLYTLIELGKSYPEGYKYFLEAPIHKLDIPEEIKMSLLTFKTYTLGLLVILYKKEDFSRGQVFKRIIEFHKIKHSAKSFNLKPINMEQNSS